MCVFVWNVNESVIYSMQLRYLRFGSIFTLRPDKGRTREEMCHCFNLYNILLTILVKCVDMRSTDPQHCKLHAYFINDIAKMLLIVFDDQLK